MYFQHDAALWRDFPALVPGVLYAEGITADAAPGTDHLTTVAKARLAEGVEGVAGFQAECSRSPHHDPEQVLRQVE